MIRYGVFRSDRFRYLPALIITILAVAGAGRAGANEIIVKNTDQFRQAVGVAKPGTTVVLAAGDYRGGGYFANLHGTEASPILIRAQDSANPPHIIGGSEGIHLSDCSYVEIHDIAFSGATGNGINIDDGGTFATPAHHIVLKNLSITDVGPRGLLQSDGNHDGIKLSGVDDFWVESCTIVRWGDDGSAIDMVGCHHGVIQDCTFRHGDIAGNGVQVKGGSEDIDILNNRFDNTGSRGVNIGGSTGLQFFRPKVEGYEAKDIRVEHNVFIGCEAPVAFVGADGASVLFNTFYHPRKWVIRILQETRAPGFVPCRDGVFSDNVTVFRSDAWAEGGVNIGPDTAPATFRFARNFWYCDDKPELSRPTLPTAESNGVIGINPLLQDPLQGDFTLQTGSPASGHGAFPAPAVLACSPSPQSAFGAMQAPG